MIEEYCDLDLDHEVLEFVGQFDGKNNHPRCIRVGKRHWHVQTPVVKQRLPFKPLYSTCSVTCHATCWPWWFPLPQRP